MILYFSGTGNSCFMATAIAKQCREPLQSINEHLRNNETLHVSAEQALTFVVPIYAGRIPRVVEHYIRNADIPHNTRIYFVATCSESMGNADVYTKRLCADKQLCYAGMCEVKMPQGYIVMFTASSDKDTEILLRAAKQQAPKIAAVIESGGVLQNRSTKWSGMSHLMNPVFYPAFVKSKGFHTSAACVGCAACVNVCPLNNVRMASKKPQWGKKCTHCMACVSSCPQTAIEFGKKTAGKKRYHCSHIPADMV